MRITFDISTRVDAVYSACVSASENEAKEKTFSLLCNVGLTQVFLGVESGSCGQLKRFGKRVGVEENLIAVSKLLKLDIMEKVLASERGILEEFLCQFKLQDYHFLKGVIKLVRQNKYLPKFYEEYSL
ncbi:MAG: hypothetical protein KKC11_00160 [Candidatus Omnitrophica bacterium]|nr:hypothetical protein [Candidatus Omnitrophota bacterium]MBU0878218.1 hypothetical protein [Candidatus Omnitrophota bacterium]MBU0896804.1 hypothetical protein [Candidatus Omnitrophota bacterium]MBU1134454.1 hypothetical protein [Candidatus Omnitrophota bacterium]MBU1810651.1 hypothetical protein [Candidatus Omnitrophota bacterium]